MDPRITALSILINIEGIHWFTLFDKSGVEAHEYINTISNFILIMIVITWVSSYVIRVVNGKMTFMEQRKRYRKEYEKIVNDKLEIKFNSLSKEEQEKLMEDLEKNT